MEYSTAPIWDNCPDTSEIAKPKATHQVHNADVIEVKNARYRCAVFSGIFLLSPNAEVKIFRGNQCAEVECCWFGHKLKTRGIRIIIDTHKGNATIKRNYSGLVVCNLEK